MKTNEVVALTTRSLAIGCLVTVTACGLAYLLAGLIGLGVAALLLTLSALVTAVKVPRVDYRITRSDPQHSDTWGTDGVSDGWGVWPHGTRSGKTLRPIDSVDRLRGLTAEEEREL